MERKFEEEIDEQECREVHEQECRPPLESLTLSGSSAETFLPGLALSGNTHSFDGLANTLPAEDDVSFPGTEPNAVVIVGVDKEELDGRGGGLAGGEDFAGGLVVRALDEEGVMLDMAVLGDGAGLGLG
jgi:hypothetical protein